MRSAPAAVAFADRVLVGSELSEDPGASTTAVSPTPSSTEMARTTATTSPAGESGVRGIVAAGPTCPVERPDDPCPSKPLAVHLLAIGADGTTVAETDSAADGTYEMVLPPGHYTLRAETGAVFPSCPDTQVTVSAGAHARRRHRCDTGIR